MDNRIVELMEQFNSEFPYGDSLELAAFMYAHGMDDACKGIQEIIDKA